VEARKKNRKKKGQKKAKNKQLSFFSVSLSHELRRLSNKGAISRHFSSHVLHLIRVKFKRGYKPNITRYFQIRYIEMIASGPFLLSKLFG
jgi:hypothetical protein